jgi:hypothetical protein
MVRTTDHNSQMELLNWGARRDGTMLGDRGDVGASNFSYENLPLVGSVKIDVVGSYPNQHMMEPRNGTAPYRHQR